ELVIEATNNKGRDRVDTYLFDLHWAKWSQSAEKPEYQVLREKMTRSLLTIRFDAKVLSREFPDNDPAWQRYVWKPDADEEPIVQRLRVAQDAQLEEHRRLQDARAVSDDPLKVGNDHKEEDLPPVFE